MAVCKAREMNILDHAPPVAAFEYAFQASCLWSRTWASTPPDRNCALCLLLGGVMSSTTIAHCLLLSVLLGTIGNSEGCFFEFERVFLRPAYVRLFYTTESVSSVQCNIDNGVFFNCPDGTELILEEGGVHSLNFAITCDNGSSIMAGPFLANTKEPSLCEAATVSRIQLRRTFDVLRMLTFSWRTTGDVHYIKCQVEQGEEFETTNPYDLPLFDRCEDRMKLRVTAFCNGRAIANSTKSFHNFNGLSCDPGCGNISFTSVPTTTYNAATSTVSVDYTTSVPSRCGCRAKSARRFTNCTEVPVTNPSGLIIISCRTVDNCRTIIRNYIDYA